MSERVYLFSVRELTRQSVVGDDGTERENSEQLLREFVAVAIGSANVFDRGQAYSCQDGQTKRRTGSVEGSSREVKFHQCAREAPSFRGCRESRLSIKSGDATLMKR